MMDNLRDSNRGRVHIVYKRRRVDDSDEDRFYSFVMESCEGVVEGGKNYDELFKRCLSEAEKGRFNFSIRKGDSVMEANGSAGRGDFVQKPIDDHTSFEEFYKKMRSAFP